MSHRQPELGRVGLRAFVLLTALAGCSPGERVVTATVFDHDWRCAEGIDASGHGGMSCSGWAELVSTELGATVRGRIHTDDATGDFAPGRSVDVVVVRTGTWLGLGGDDRMVRITDGTEIVDVPDEASAR